MILPDANVWIYLLDATTPQHKAVRTRLPRLMQDVDVLIPAVIQMEVLHYMVRRLGADAADAIDAFLTQPAEIAPLTAEVTGEAARLLMTHRATGIGGRDAAILVIARRKQATLLTNDKALTKVATAMGITVENPAK